MRPDPHALLAWARSELAARGQELRQPEGFVAIVYDAPTRARNQGRNTEHALHFRALPERLGRGDRRWLTMTS